MRAARTAWWVGSLLLGCGAELPPPSYIEATEIFTVRHEVEIGPLDPERVGPLIAGASKPIAEVLPGDQLRLHAVVIDVDGNRLPEFELETLWLQCGHRPCADARTGIGLTSPAYDQPCDELDKLDAYTTDSYCLLGTGTGRFEFEIPQLGPYALPGGFGPDYEALGPLISMFAVVAWDGRRAQDCWNSRRGDLANLDRCGFIFHDVKLGPIWWVYGYAAQLGFEIPFEIDPAMFPAQVFFQPANRIPRTPTLQIMIDDELVAEGVPPFAPIPVGPGARIEVALSFDPLSQLFQSSFEPLSRMADDAFIVVPERLYSRTATSGSIVQRGELNTVIGDGSFFYEVDGLTDPGISRVLIGYRDERGANDVLTLEFEHQ